MKILLYSLIFIVLLNGCKSIPECVEDEKSGNLGKLFNTLNDEYAPFFYDNKLYFTSLNIKNPEFVRIYYSEYENNSFSDLYLENNLPLNYYPNSGLPVFFNYNDRKFLIFAGMNNNVRRINSDLFISEFKNNQWTIPEPILELNTDNYESYPSISPDGNFLVFVSDRDGGFGGLDIYLTSFDGEKWLKPINLGENINSDSDEISPTILNNYDVIFSSNRMAGNGGFDLYLSPYENESWSNPVNLGIPINSKRDEIGATLINNRLVLSSDRDGGCGGKDLYAFDFCKEIIYRGIVKCDNNTITLEGKAYLLDEKKNVLEEKEVGQDGIFEFRLTGFNKYFVRYNNYCIPSYIPDQEIITSCSFLKNIRYNANFIIDDASRLFDFTNYKVPFFVTGYYQPNTIDNLNSLKLKFNYNLLGNNEKTRYIENPGDKYDDYAPKVEEALNEVISFYVK